MKKNKSTYLIIFQLIFSTIFVAALISGTPPSSSTGITDATPMATASWSPATVISDDASLWNNLDSVDPAIAIAPDGSVHVVWEDETDGGWWGVDREIMYMKLSEGSWSTPLVISDEITNWNNAYSQDPDIAIDSNGLIHVVWSDDTNGWWASDYEIMYTNYTPGVGWTNATVISDDATLWNNGGSYAPSIAVAPDDSLHVAWEDETNGWWQSDREIMYANCTPSTGWTNATLISDNASLWNDGNSFNPDIVIDSNGLIHVVWDDYTTGWWADDREIMYAKYTPNPGWSDPTVISDDATDWNNDSSYAPAIALAPDDSLHVVWIDATNGWWGDDYEIMYVKYTPNPGWSTPLVISDDATLWNDGDSYYPDITVDATGTIHVVWEDFTEGPWSTIYMGGPEDFEIWYAQNTGTGWSSATLVSDGPGTNWWNTDYSGSAAIAVDDGTVYVVWEDSSLGDWGGGSDDQEIMISIFVPGSTGGSILIILLFPLIGLGLVLVLVYLKRDEIFE